MRNVIYIISALSLAAGCASAPIQQRREIASSAVSGAETVEAFLVATDHFAQIVADSYSREEIKISRINYLARLCQTLQRFSMIHDSELNGSAAELGEEPLSELNLAILALAKISALIEDSKKGTTVPQLKDILYAHHSTMTIESAQAELLKAQDKFIIRILEESGERAAERFKQIREVLAEDLP